MVERQEGPSEGPVWYLQQDVQVALLWNQLNAVCSQLAQTNQQLCLQQNVILGLQQQQHTDQKLISKLVDRLLEPECDTESTDTGSPRSDSEESLDAEWILVHDASAEAVAMEAAAPVAAELLHCAATTRSQADSPEKGKHPVAPSSAAALWLGLPICHRRDSCDVPESSPLAAECQDASSEEPEPPKQSLGGRADAACQTDGEDGSVCGLLKDATATLCSHSPTTLTDIEVGGGECTPSDLHVANLLPYLGVQDLLRWRLVCRRTRSPEALTAHVAEMGSMDTPDAILFFAEQLHQFCVNPHVSFEAAFGGDAEQHKLCECRLWCMALASKTLTHFGESYVRRTVGRNLQSLLRHCWSADTSVAAAAHDIVHNHASDALPFVQQAIAESMLGLMEDLVTSNMRANLKQIGPCARTLEKILRSLSKPQCQKWVSLTVKLLMDPHVTDKERLVWQLKMLWLVDDDPKRTYAEAEQQLLTVAVCDIGAFKNDLLGAGGDLMWLQAYSTDAAFGEVMNVNADLLSDAGLQEADVQDLAITIENKMQQVSISWDTFSLWELDTVDLSDKDRQNLNLCLLFSRRATSIRDKTLATPEWLERCGNFLDECQSGYDSGTIAPYHTWLHAVDATYTLYRIMTLIAAEQYLGHLECFGLLVAAIAHDMGHRGRSNVFLVEIGHELAIRYNDIAILENMHCSLLFQILSQDKMNILSELSEPIYNHIRHVIVDAILATDFAQHTGMVKEFESMYGVNSELFDMADEMYMTMDEFPPNELLEYFKTHDVKKSLRTVLLHFSDISNPMKPFPIAEKWAALVLEEFALQGDEEKALGIPMGPLNDRDTVNTPLSQIGFIEFVVAPLALSLARVLPPLWFSNQMILDNANIWMDKWIEGTLLKPSLEEQVNVRERIHRMVQKTEQRGYTATMT
ncbi:PDE9A, partial [Symbiodinium microadriaticum]